MRPHLMRWRDLAVALRRGWPVNGTGKEDPIFELHRREPYDEHLQRELGELPLDHCGCFQRLAEVIDGAATP
jgi:hypothetical protein